MYQGWFCLGGTEIINNMRTMGYAATASQLTNRWGIPELSLVEGVPDVWPNYCNINWFVDDDECPNLYDALNETWLPQPPFPLGPLPWEAQYILEDAPWASDSPYEAAQKFMGVFALEVSELSDSTRGLSIVEGIADGGVLGRSRLSVPRFRFRVLLTALDTDGLEYGTAWLSRTLAEQSCASHGSSCGSTDLSFLASCPPPPEAFFGTEGRSEPSAEYDMLLRTYHDVKCISGPVVVEDIVGRAPNTYGRIVEFDLAAGVPNLFGKVGMTSGELDSTFATIVTDSPRNSIAVPSAELAAPGVVVIATNYSTNPSVETNATGWVTATDGVGITPAMVASGRVTGELAAVGTAAYRAAFTATGVGTSGWLAVQQEVSIAGRPADSRVSVNYWAAEALIQGTATRAPIEMTATWRDGAGGATLRTDVLGTVPVAGGAVSAKGLIPPAGATHVLIQARAEISNWSANAIVRLYGDALAVTVP